MLHNPQEREMFPRLTDEDLDFLREYAEEVHLKPGEVFFREGDPAQYFYVVISGQMRITKRINNTETLLTVHQPREFGGSMELLTGAPCVATATAQDDTHLFWMPGDRFRYVLGKRPETMSVIVNAVARRAYDVEAQKQQNEKLTALGRLAAGLAHELNNPAAAAQRTAAQLHNALEALQACTVGLAKSRVTAEQAQTLRAFQLETAARARDLPILDPVEQCDREDAITAWLDDQNVEESWRFTSVLVGAGLTVNDLQQLAAQHNLGGEQVAPVMAWLVAALDATQLIGQIEHSTARISELVRAVKEYSYMDQAPVQEIDVHQGIENTLTMLRHKLKNITVNREYDSNLPHIEVHGSELNQVWTNLIDNAADVLKGEGEITIKTFQDGTCVCVEIQDNGPGIPEDVQRHIFEPFFTTKGVGQGSGLGLDIVRRIVVQHHGGNIYVNSQPGETRFQVYIPIDQKPEAAATTEETTNE